MLAVAITDIQVLYENQPLLTQEGGFPPPGAEDNVAENEEEDGSAS